MQGYRGVRPILFLSAALGCFVLNSAWDLAAEPSDAEAGGSKRQIVISRTDSLPGKAFDIIGRVSEKVRNPGLTESNEQLEERSSQHLVGKARQIGADAVLGVHGLPADPDLHPRWVSGVAVRFIEPGGSAARQRARFIVVVLPIEIPDSLVTNAKSRSQLADQLRDQARSDMETHGYYAQQNGFATADSSELAAMTDSVWNATFGEWTEHVLSIRFGTSHSSTILIQAKQETSVEAWMYSRTAGHVVWRTEAVGTGTNWGPHQVGAFNVFETKEVMLEKSLRSAVSRVLKEVPTASD